MGKRLGARMLTGLVRHPRNPPLADRASARDDGGGYVHPSTRGQAERGDVAPPGPHVRGAGGEGCRLSVGSLGRSIDRRSSRR